jgi:hypothetical protein
MTAAAEAKMAIRNTRAFIDADPVTVVFLRPVKEETPAGGIKSGPPLELPPQRARLVPLSGNVWDRSKQKVDEGNIPDVTFQLIGMPGFDVRKGDEFLVAGDEWKVTHVSPERTVRVSAGIMLKSQDDQEHEIEEP